MRLQPIASLSLATSTSDHRLDFFRFLCR